jgi:hypothetical protein
VPTTLLRLAEEASRLAEEAAPPAEEHAIVPSVVVSRMIDLLRAEVERLRRDREAA